MIREPVFPEYKNLNEIVLQDGAELPDPLFTVVGNTGQISEHALSDLRDGALAWGATLSSQINRGDRVVLCMPTSIDALQAFFGILLAGGVAVPMPYAFTHRADYLEQYVTTRTAVIDDCGAVAMATHPDHKEVGLILAERCKDLTHIVTSEDLGDPENTFEPVDADLDDLAVLQYTSGSTGDPKGVTLTHGCVLWNLRAIGEGLEPRASGERVVSWLPLYHDMGLIGGWLYPLGSGFRHAVLATEVFLADPTFWHQAMTQLKATITVAPNFGYALSVKRVKDALVPMLDLSQLRICICGAEPIDAVAMAAFQKKFAGAGLQQDVIFPVYGLAEATLAVTFSPVKKPIIVRHLDRARLESDGLVVDVEPDTPDAFRVVCVGSPLRDGQVRIVNREGETVPHNQQGEILVRSGSLMKGYFGRAEATARTLEDGWLHTEDLGFLDDNGLFVTGRIKDMIITYGRNFYPHDLEWLSVGVKGVRQGCVAAFGVPNKDASTEEIVIVAETRVTEREQLIQIRRDIRKLLIETIECNPKHILLVPPRAVPKTTSGKIRRVEAQKMYLSSQFQRLL